MGNVLIEGVVAWLKGAMVIDDADGDNYGYDLRVKGDISSNGKRIPTITVSTDEPSGGQHGDIWFKVD